MTILHYLIGYSKSDGSLVTEVIIPHSEMAVVRRWISLYPDDPHAFDPYELMPWQARQIAELAGEHITGTVYDYFLQAFDEPDEATQSAGLAAH